MYGLGAILYHLLTGRPPFQGATWRKSSARRSSAEPVRPTQLQPRIPRDLETICLKCLQKEPAKRYATALALAEDLRRFQAGEPITARPVGPVERGWRWGRRNPATALLGATAALMLLAVSIVSVVFAVTEGGAARTLQAEKDKTDRAGSQLRTEKDRAEAALKESAPQRSPADRRPGRQDLRGGDGRPGVRPLRRTALAGAGRGNGARRR